MATPLMLDPSLFLSFRTLRLIRAAFDAGELKDAVVPGSFVSAVQKESFRETGLAYFGASRKEISDLRNIRSIMETLELFPSYELPTEDAARSELRNQLARVTPSPEIFEILNEEWLFLNSQSWFASRTRKPLSTFIRAGAVAVEGGRKLFDEVTMRMLKISPESVPLGLTRGQRLRAAAKWLAVGGISSTTFLHPLSGALVGLTSKKGAASLLRNAEYLRDQLAHSQYDLFQGSSWQVGIGHVKGIEDLVHRSDDAVEQEAKAVRKSVDALWLAG
jgi:hypothetical protein